MDAHGELSERSKRDKDLEGLGTTCIALMRSGTSSPWSTSATRGPTSCAATPSPR